MLKEVKQFFYAAVICTMTLTACTTPFKKAKDGTEYKVINKGKGPAAVNGNILEMDIVTKYKDSVLYSTVEDGMPKFERYDTAQYQTPLKELFKNLHVGDSLVLRLISDSIINKGQAAPFMKKGAYLYQTYKIRGIYTENANADGAYKSHLKTAQVKMYNKQLQQVEKTLQENKATLDADSKLIDEYLAKNNIKATKTKWGTYVSITQEGTGNVLTTQDVASVKYTGKTFDSSKVFDSNIDPAFQHTEPLELPLNRLEGIIPGWPDALLQMKKGAKATVYIPSPLAYGKGGRAPLIKPDQILIFDMEVVGVTTQEALAAKQEAEQKAAQEQQQKMMDSMRKANPRIDEELKKKGK